MHILRDHRYSPPHAVYNNLNPTAQSVPASFHNFCQATGTIDVFSELSKVIATALFCLYYLSKIKNPLKGNTSLT